MKNKKLLILMAICLAILMAALPFVSACGTSSPEVKALKVGMMTPSTGPAAEKGAPMGDANLDAMKYINDELGGVNGYPIDVLWLDSKYDAAQVATNVKRFMDEGCLLFTTAASKEMSAAMEIANRAEFPGLVCFNAPILHRPPQHIYGQMTDYGDDWAAFANYYMQNIWKGPGKPKMALHLLNNTTGYGARDAAKAGAEQMGIEIIAIEEHKADTISETESLTRDQGTEPGCPVHLQHSGTNRTPHQECC